MARLTYPRAEAVETATNALFEAVDRSAADLARQLNMAREAREPIGDLYAWLSRSRPARHGTILQRAVCAAIACDSTYHVRQQIRFCSRPGTLRGSIVVDCVVHDTGRNTFTVYEITSDVGSRSVSMWEQRAAEVRQHLNRFAKDNNGAASNPPLVIITTRPESNLDDIGIPVLQASHLKDHFGLTAGWAIKSASRRFDLLVEEAMRDAGL